MEGKAYVMSFLAARDHLQLQLINFAGGCDVLFLLHVWTVSCVVSTCCNRPFTWTLEADMAAGCSHQARGGWREEGGCVPG